MSRHIQAPNSIQRALFGIAVIAACLGLSATLHAAPDDEAEAEIRAASEEVERASMEAGRAGAEAAMLAAKAMARDARAAGQIDRAALKDIHRAAAAAKAAGGRALESGAVVMASTSERLRTSREFREKQIRDAAQQGRKVTHEELLDIADELQRQAVEARADAARMRAEADREHDLH